MLNLSQVNQDFNSRAHTLLAHLTLVLMRLGRADGGLAVLRDRRSGEGVVFVNMITAFAETAYYNRLRRWVDDPASRFWYPACHGPDLTVHVTYPADDTSDHQCDEVASFMDDPMMCKDGRALSVTLGTDPGCRILLVKLMGGAVFSESDVDRLTRYAVLGRQIVSGADLRAGLFPDPIGDEPPRVSGFPPCRELMDSLSDTERVVFRLLGAGKTERTAAELINRSPHTVHVHVKSIYRKLQIRSRAELKALFCAQSSGSPVADSRTPSGIAEAA